MTVNILCTYLKRLTFFASYLLLLFSHPSAPSSWLDCQSELHTAGVLDGGKIKKKDFICLQFCPPAIVIIISTDDLRPNNSMFLSAHQLYAIGDQGFGCLLPEEWLTRENRSLPNHMFLSNSLLIPLLLTMRFLYLYTNLCTFMKTELIWSFDTKIIHNNIRMYCVCLFFFKIHHQN